ncbi:sigma-70 family RNA polymerase sigma factor [Streptomyces sp. B8F3]|uniref:sigma-70 family RNA polymerase sigma factor n=1 Tax=unclassified Streptomyces TaxID=2593676 RepID=UPI00325E09E8
MSDPTPNGDPAAEAYEVTEAFEAQRDRLRSVAYRMLGSHADAEDVVQEAWLRLSRQDAAAVRNLPGWLTTVVGRICLDVLRARQARPEAAYDDGLPEPVVTLDDGGAPEDDAVLADSVGLALLVVLESLGPGERLAFVLHDLFAVPFDEIGRILGKSTAATKMLASRARRKVRTSEPPPGGGRERRAVVDAFLAAARRGDFEELLRVLHPEVKLTVDTPSGVVVTLGATRVAAGAQLSAGASARGRAVLVDGRPGIVSWHEDGSVQAVLAFTVTGERITAIRVVIDPARLASMDLPDPAPDPAGNAEAGGVLPTEPAGLRGRRPAGAPD